MKLKDFKKAFYLLITMVKLRFIAYKLIGTEILTQYHPMAIVKVSLKLHLKLMIFTFIFFYLKNQVNELLAYFTTVAGCFLIVLGKIIHTTYLKEREEVEKIYFKRLEEESKKTPLNESATKH